MYKAQNCIPLEVERVKFFVGSFRSSSFSPSSVANGELYEMVIANRD